MTLYEEEEDRLRLVGYRGGTSICIYNVGTQIARTSNKVCAWRWLHSRRDAAPACAAQSSGDAVSSRLGDGQAAEVR